MKHGYFFGVLLFLLLAGCQPSRQTAEPVLAVKNWKAWSVPVDGLKVPAVRSIAFGNQKDVYTLDTAGRVLVFDLEGKLMRQWFLPEITVGKPEGICVLGDGRVVVCDTHYHRILMFDGKGKVLHQFGREGQGEGEFIYPVAISKDADDNLYIAEYGGNDRVTKFTKEGKFLLAFGSFGIGAQQFQRPSGIAWHQRKVYVADAINNRIQIFSDVGKFEKTLEGNGLQFPYGIAYGRDESLYVVEYGAGRITKLDGQGVLLGRYGRTGIGEGQFLTPWGLALDPTLRLWVADKGNSRLVELKF